MPYRIRCNWIPAFAGMTGVDRLVGKTYHIIVSHREVRAVNTPLALSAGYRALSDFEVMTLEVAGCAAEDWSKISVAEDFDPRALSHVRFSGENRLGSFRDTVRLPGGVERACGIHYASLHECTVGNDAYIHNVRRHIAHYDIAAGVIIDDVGLIAIEGETTFGNGVLVDVLNEAGGRKIPIFDRLSSQAAYALAVYPHRDALQKHLRAIVASHVNAVRGRRGAIGAGARIVSCGTLINTKVGEAAVLQGVRKLAEVSLNSNPHAPVVLGEGVIGERLVVASGASIDGGAQLTRCFVGQGARIGRQFSADNSLFFANCEAQHGEACSLFAGPYTVTHHKSSLLIAGLFSFYNAGSGSNQSNHHYKLGPLHQGVLERGSKTGSSSYLMWCSRIGPFTAVVGKHARPVDVADFPFSYLVESAGQSVLIPAAALANVGTLRDIHKWKDRDRRTDPDLLDRLNFEAFSPYTMGRMHRAVATLTQLAEQVGSRENISLGGAQIPAARLHRAAGLYRMAVQMYLGGKIASRIEAALAAGGIPRWPDLFQTTGEGQGEWTDLAGLLAPTRQVDSLLADIEQGGLHDLLSLESRLLDLHAGYDRLEWDWVAALWLESAGLTASNVTTADVRQAITTWKSATAQYNQGVLRDAEQEFKESAKVGYGLGGEADAATADFAAVRGAFDQNAFVCAVQEQTQQVAARADAILAHM